MDGSKYFQPARDDPTPHGATRLALSIDKDAVGLMKHAAEIGHLVEWWLQGNADAMGTMAAFRLGRKLERFRLAARLSEGRVSKPVQATLDALKQELAAHRAPQQIMDAVARTHAEAARLEAALAAPATIVRRAFHMEPDTQPQQPVQQRQRTIDDDEDDEDADRAGKSGTGILRWVLLAALAGGGAWLALSETGSQLLQPVIQSLAGLLG
jgi:hypothetical protein